MQGEATEIATQSVSATATVSEQQLEDLPLRTQKFTEALSVSPSVIRTQEGKLNFNGQAESQGMLLVDSAENVDPVSGSFAIPVPVNAIQYIQVFSTPDSSAYGGFSGGLTRIDIKPPGPGMELQVSGYGSVFPRQERPSDRPREYDAGRGVRRAARSRINSTFPRT